MKDNEMMVGAILVASVILLAGMVITANQIGKHIDDSIPSEPTQSDELFYQSVCDLNFFGGTIYLVNGETITITPYLGESVDYKVQESTIMVHKVQNYCILRENIVFIKTS